jgi:hypothetical protein
VEHGHGLHYDEEKRKSDETRTCTITAVGDELGRSSKVLVIVGISKSEVRSSRTLGCNIPAFLPMPDDSPLLVLTPKNYKKIPEYLIS